MFSKELENLIQATLEDGMLEDFEKAALVKRAQAEGVDLAELEIYINSILQKRQKAMEKEKNEKIEQHKKEKKEAFGRVCPNCGKQVPPMTLKCECGFEFTNANSSSSVQLLSEKIDTINATPGTTAAEKEKLICDTIEMFPVPNTKEDILEFLSLAASNLKNCVPIYNTLNGRIAIYIIATVISVGWFLILGLFLGWFKNLSESEWALREKREKAWKAKFDQIILKARSLRGDADFTKQLDYYEGLVNSASRWAFIKK